MHFSNSKYYVYAIKSRTKNYVYVGITNNLERRIGEHNNGYNKSTKSYAPFDLIFTEPFNSKRDARLKEKYLNSGVGKEYLKSLL